MGSGDMYMASSANGRPKIELVRSAGNHGIAILTSPRLRRVEWQRITGFTGFVAAIALLAAFLITDVIVMPIVLHPRMPGLLLSGFSVRDLSVSNDSVMLANWYATITVENRNRHTRLELALLRSYVYYKDPNKYLTWKEMNGPVIVDTGPSWEIDLRMMTTWASEQPDIRVVQAVGEDLRSNKPVVLGLAVELEAKFKYSWWWKKHKTKTVYCDGVVIELKSESSTGSAGSLDATDNPMKCLP